MAVLRGFLEQHAEEIVEVYVTRVRQRVARYATADPKTFPENTRRLVAILGEAAEQADSERIIAFVSDLVHERLPEGFLLTDILEAMCQYHPVVAPMIWRYEDDPAHRLPLVEELHEAITHLALRFTKAYVDYQMELLDRHKQAIEELSTPVITVWDGILALPLIGTIDTYRSRQIMDELLRKIASERAAIVLIDITGVPVVDTHVADHLIKTVRAAELLGARCMLVGVGPELSQTIVSLGVDLRSITCTADMRQGLSAAYRKLGLKVVRSEDS